MRKRNLALSDRVKASVRQNADALFVLALVLLLFVVLAAAHPRFLSVQNIIGVLQQSMFLLVVSVGMTVVIVAGGLDLSVGSVAALASSVAAMTLLQHGAAAGLAAGLAIGLAAGAINGLVVTRLAVNPFIATMAMMVGARGLALAMTGGAASISLPRSFEALGSLRLLGIPLLLFVTLAVFVAGFYLLHHSGFGLRVFAVGSKAAAARLSGISVSETVLLAFVWSGLCAGIAGLMFTARFNSGLPTTGVFLELYAVAAVVLGGTRLSGGRGGLLRTLLGVLLIAFLQNGLNLFNVSFYWQQVAIGVVFLCAAISSLAGPAAGAGVVWTVRRTGDA